MSISYVVDRQRGAVLSRWEGDVTADELRAHWAEVLDDPEARALARTVADLREAQPRFSGAELQRAVVEIAAPRLVGLRWINAIVVSRPEQFGVSRQFDVFAEFHSANSIFASVDAALTWVLGQ
jgi:hypothetical protein